ncbi:hypothetical protein E4U46_002734 [Claviceps purpurea]|nr:hypothetical protein E4U46_002734 [Claviceps purpurea]
MAAAGITGSGGSKNARYIRHKDTRGMIDIPEGKNDDQASVNPRAKTGHHDLVKSRPRSRGGGNGCDVDIATPAIGVTSTETENQSETTTATGSATVTASATTGDPVTDFSGQGFADGKIAVRNAPRHPPSTSLKTRYSQPADDYESTLDVDLTPVTISLATAPASSPSAAPIGENRISTAIAITIGLATVAGLALLAAAIFLWMAYRRRRRSGRRSTRKTKSDISSPLVPLETLAYHSTSPASLALPAPVAKVDRAPTSTATIMAVPAPAHAVRPFGSSSGLKLKDVQGGGSPWWRSYGGLDRETTGVNIGMDEVQAPDQHWSIPPPMLMDRKLHPSINGSASSVTSTKSTSKSHRGHVRGRHTPLVASNSGANWQVSILPIMAIQPPLRSVRPGATMSSASSIQITEHDSRTLTSSPETRRELSIPDTVMGLKGPGPPPSRALPSPPQNRCINTSSRPTKSHVNTLHPKEIGVAVSGSSHLGITIDKPYYQVWCDASRWQPPKQSTPGEQTFF